MTKEAEYKRDFKITQRWSENHKSYAHDSVNRHFDNVVEAGKVQEDSEAYRQKKLSMFHAQPQRGKNARNGEVSQMQDIIKADRTNLNNQTKKARDLVSNVMGKDRDKSVSHSRSVLHENVSQPFL